MDVTDTVRTGRCNLQFFRGGSKVKINIGILASASGGRIERGFDLLGYHFGPEGLTAARKTLYNFVERAIRLYKQEPPALKARRLGEYVKQWVRWAGEGLGNIDRVIHGPLVTGRCLHEHHGFFSQ